MIVTSGPISLVWKLSDIFETSKVPGDIIIIIRGGF